MGLAMLNIPAPRLLPMAILAMGALLATRAAELGGFGPTRIAPAAVHGAAQLMQTGLLPPAQAQTAPPLSQAPVSPASLNPGAGRGRAAMEAAGAGASLPNAQPLPVAQEPAGPPPISAAERQLLEDLRARRLTLDAREQEISTREAVLAAAERRLSQRVEELAAMQARLETLDRAAREREEANWNNLVRIYENMRPRDAARIFDELDMAVLLEVVARMKQRAVAPILAGMQPDRAQKVTAELAARQMRRTDG
jgi:flagellar motility protein MotE (MotC chaperone)